ncbi:methyl-accepting chemotaxis protein [Baekduia soli]|uniref:Methyl-accepting chemotaxis protein n=1 Tax=Baekduia soli TaxID=496014 RepID=A0A5B8U7Y0_9ACTN|nr:methyl-accepting chemotaxis protein [Baekduia soli]QEC49174.1 methyl-accepting chemotaxis protein [Baekduia soli]
MPRSTARARPATIRLTVGRRLAAGFGTVIALMLVALAVADSGTSRLRADTKAVGLEIVPAVRMLGETTTGIRQFRVAQLERVNTVGPADQKAAEQELTSTAATVDSLLARLRTLPASPAERAAAARTAADWATYRRGSGPFLAALQRGPQAGFDLLTGTADGTYDKLTTDIKAWSTTTQARGDARVASSAHDATTTRVRMMLALLAAVLVALLANVLVGRSIRRAVREVLDRLSSLRDHCAEDLTRGLRAFAEGDLTQEVVPVTPPIERPGSDEVGDVARATNEIRERFLAMIASYNASREALATLVGQVAGTAGSVSTASRQMAATSDETGRAVAEIAAAVNEAAVGAERQVAVIGEARSIADDVIAVTSRSADDAAGTAQVAEEARRIAGEGAAAVGGATEAMASVREASAGATAAIRELGDKSAQIGGIVDTITGIAEQTNLLALNAAIEAARAGDQGRGFAVVADEVRKLAEESRSAAASIAALITDIQAETARVVEIVEDGGRRTEQGSAVVGEARDAFERIGGAVDDVTARVGAIAAAVEQIAAAAREMGDRMNEVAGVAEESSAGSEQISATTQQTSASTVQIAASAQELARTAGDLEALVARFTLTRD